MLSLFLVVGFSALHVCECRKKDKRFINPESCDIIEEKQRLLTNFGMGMIAVIRPATIADASRIAEILIFSKRVNYRKIFQNDKVSFGEMQVYPLAQSYIDHPDTLSGIWVFDDEFVKGMVHIEDKEIVELYIDPFFGNQGIGSRLMEFAARQMHCDYLWVLEKNVDAIRFYQRHGFVRTEEKKYQEGTPEFIVKMKRWVSGKRGDGKQ